MEAEYVLTCEAPHNIYVSCGSHERNVSLISALGAGEIVETFDGDETVALPFTKAQALQLRTFLKSRDVFLTPRDKAILKSLADSPEDRDDSYRWEVAIVDLMDEEVSKRGKVRTAWDRLHYYPHRYIDRSNPQGVKELVLDSWSVVVGTIVQEPEWYERGNFAKIIIEDVNGDRISAPFFRQRWLTWKYHAGDEVIIYGNYSEFVDRNKRRYPQITNAQIDSLSSVRGQRPFLPVYPKKEGDKAWELQQSIERFLEGTAWVKDPVPEALLKKHEMMSRDEAYREIHFPTSREKAEKARRRLAFDEYVRLQVFLLQRRKAATVTPSSVKKKHGWAKAFEESLSFDFTEGQKTVIKEISEDMGSTKPMYRLLQGDVGAGKAQPLYSKVLTPAGFVAMGDISVGDTVITPEGGMETVLGVYPQGERPVYELTFTDGSVVRADEEHLWKAWYGNDKDAIIASTNMLRDVPGNWFVESAEWLVDGGVAQPVRLPRVRIQDITFIGQEETQCIYLSGEEHLYVTDDFIVTHNTEVSSYATLVAVESGSQVVLVAPTDILAGQLYERLEKTFGRAGLGDKMQLGLLSGRITGKRRTAILDAVADGSIDVLVGTHAVFSPTVQFKNLGLAIVDEQHKFGTEQRTSLLEKAPEGSQADFLMMSATPIPRSIAQVKFGDMDLSILAGVPAGRKPVETQWVLNQTEAWDKVREQVEAGHQAYVVAPMVEENENLENVKAAQETFEHLCNSVFPDLRIGLVHGKLKAAEKNDIINSFYEGHLDVLVSTTVIEVGVNVPNATVMVVLDANRFGIASLHQIRGRVGRGDAQAYCYLVADPKNPEAEDRLNAVVSSTDGFWLAERDLEIRGEGNLFGAMQAGQSGMLVANLREHKDLVELSRTVALQASRSAMLSYEVKKLFDNKEIQA